MVISARDFGGAEILRWDQHDGPIMPEHASRLIQLAGDAFARAYGYYEHDWSGELVNFTASPVVDKRPSLDVYYQSCCALDGLRVVAQELRAHNLQTAVYSAYFALNDWGPRGLPIGELPEGGSEFARRFPYSLGLAHGQEGRDAVLEASRSLDRPDGLVEEIQSAVSRAIRSAPAEQLREAEALAADQTGEAWVELPAKVRDDLAQAEYMQTISYHSSFNWAPVALLYCIAVERLLCENFGSGLERFLIAQGITPSTFLEEHGVRLKHGLSRGMIGEFAFLMRQCLPDPKIAEFMAKTPLEHSGRLRDIGGRIDGFNQKYRRFTAHAAEAVSGSTIRDMKRSIYESSNGTSDSLVYLLANLRLQ